MRKRLITVIAFFLVICLLLPSCANGGDVQETTQAETETDKTENKGEETTGEDAPDETTGEAETEGATKAPETTKTPDTTKAPETTDKTPVTDNSAVTGGVGGGSVNVGPVIGGDSGSSTTKPPKTETPNTPETSAPPADEKVPEGYIKTGSGKLIVHTISDRSVNGKDDNSTTLPFQPMKSTTVKTDPKADYNTPKIKLEYLRPGALTNGVLAGYDDYMFYKDTLYDFEGLGFLASVIYDRTVQTLKERNDWAEANGKKFYFVIAPNKNSIYSDYMPESYTLAEYRRYDQFVELIEDAGITAVDLRGPLKAAVAANPTENLYYKYDTHWNNHAGYYAYRATMDLIDDDFPSVVIHDRSEYQINYAETYMKDLLWYLGNYDKVKDYGPVYTLKSQKTARLATYVPKQSWGQFQFAHTWEDGYSDKLYFYQYINDYNTNAPNIYIMRDSYSIAMVPFLKDSFYKSTYNWTFSFSEAEIEKAEADIIMAIVAERNLRNYVNNKAVVD